MSSTRPWPGTCSRGDLSRWSPSRERWSGTDGRPASPRRPTRPSWTGCCPCTWRRWASAASPGRPSFGVTRFGHHRSKRPADPRREGWRTNSLSTHTHTNRPRPSRGAGTQDSQRSSTPPSSSSPWPSSRSWPGRSSTSRAERRSAHQVAVPIAEGLGRDPGGLRDRSELLRILDVLAVEPDHVLPRYPVRARLHVDEPDPDPSRVRVVEGPERQRDHVPLLERDHPAPVVALLQPLQVVDRAVPEISRVLDVERDGRRAPQLVSDAL